MSDQLHDGRRLPIFIHSHVDDMTDLTPNAMRVYMHIARRAGKGEAWPSYQSIGDHCFSSVYKNADVRKRHAISAIKELVDAKLIDKQERVEPGGQRTNLYTLLDTTAPAVTVESPPEGLRSHPPSDCRVTPPVTVESPKGSPIEVNSNKGTPREECVPASDDADPPPDTGWWGFVKALCWVCYGHQEPNNLTQAQSGQLLSEARRISHYTKDDLREWFQRYWINHWKWTKLNKRGQPQHERPTPSEVRAFIAQVKNEVPEGFDQLPNGGMMNWDENKPRRTKGGMAVEEFFADLRREGIVLDG